MGYVKKWIPPVVTNTLASWKEQIEDIHTNLLTSGLGTVPDAPGQLDLDSVTTHPLTNVDVGYRMYMINDGLSDVAPIYIRITFGGIVQGLYNSAYYFSQPTLRCKVSFASSFNSDTGALVDPIGEYHYPQEYNGDNRGSQPLININGISMLCNNPETGFFGYVQGAGSRIGPSTGAGYYEGASIVIMIQRSSDDEGNPTAEGFSVYGSAMQGWSSGALNTSNGYPNSVPAAYCQSFQYANKLRSTKDNNMAFRLGGNVSDIIGTQLQPQQVFSYMPTIKPIRGLLTYKTSSLPAATEFTAERNPGLTEKFIALGRGCGLHPDPSANIGAHFTIAMLWQ